MFTLIYVFWVSYQVEIWEPQNASRKCEDWCCLSYCSWDFESGNTQAPCLSGAGNPRILGEICMQGRGEGTKLCWSTLPCFKEGGSKTQKCQRVIGSWKQRNC